MHCICRRTWTRQYIFVAATMPSGEGKSVASDLKSMMPDLQWLTGQSLHEVQPRVSQTWLPVTQETRQDALKVAETYSKALQRSAVLYFVLAQVVAGQLSQGNNTSYLMYFMAAYIVSTS